MPATPVLMTHERAGAGIDPEYFAKGLFRTQSYSAWLDQKRRADALSGEPHREPQRRSDTGALDGVQHPASPDEIIDHFTKLGAIIARTAGSSPEEQEKARQAKEMSELGELGKRGGTGDAHPMQE